MPTWAYLYRRFIGAVADAGFRAVAYDQLGFGRSDKPLSPREHSIERWVRHLDAVVRELELDGVTLVVHDWGGIVGLRWAVDHVESVKRVVMFNTHTGAVDVGRAPLPYALLRPPVVGDLLTRGVDVFGLALRHGSKLDDAARAAYRRPFRSWASRAVLAQAPRLLPFDAGNASRAVVERTADALGKLYARPKLMLWGMRDPILGPRIMQSLRDRLGQVEVRELREASHFVQEDAPERAIEYLLAFLRRT